MPANRVLHVTVKVTGSQASDGNYSATAQYCQKRSEPPMPGVVGLDGEINLESLQEDPHYKWAIDIKFKLDASITDRNGRNVPCTWASPPTTACVITGRNGRSPNNMSVSQPSPAELMIDNDNNERHRPRADRTYSYKLAVMLPSVNNYLISLDPRIVNTGRPAPIVKEPIKDKIWIAVGIGIAIGIGLAVWAWAGAREDD